MGMGLGEMGCCGARKPDAAGLKDFKVQLAARKRVEAMCGWCLELSQHTFADGKILLGRVGWNCDNCKGRTIPHASGNFARHAPGKGKKEVQFPIPSLAAKLQQKKAVAFGELLQESRVRNLIAEQADSREEARQVGMLRPYLLLISMPAASRMQIAILLGWAMLEEAYFGTPPVEAWELISKDGMGLVARLCQSQSSFLHDINPWYKPSTDWYQLVCQLSTELFGKSANSERLSSSASLRLCQSDDASKIDEVEQLFVENIALAVHSRMESRQIGMVSQLQQSDIVNNALDKMQKVGIPRKGMGQYIMEICYMALAKRDGSDYEATVQDYEVVEEMDSWMGRYIQGHEHVFESKCEQHNPTYQPVFEPPESSILGALFDPLWLTMDIMSVSTNTRLGRLTPIVLHILIQRSRLALHGISISSR